MSSEWNLRALCVIMRSSFVTEQIRSVSQEMRGGFIRYQAQNLRNVHIPSYGSLTADDVTLLAALYGEKDMARVDTTVNAIVQKTASRQKSGIRQMEFFSEYGA